MKHFLYLTMFFLLSGCAKDPCEKAVCLNGGYCLNGSCICTGGYSGKNCEVDPVPACQTYHYGSLRIANNHLDYYNVYVGGVYKGNTLTSITVDNLQSGYYPIRAEQTTGYVLYPTVYNGGATVQDCMLTTVSF